ncbi:lipoprotein cytochrome c, 1 heme-binding site [Citrifermentans bemidjiense Bem]|uniref:Lipoprotein cytochrome c, 1 heme-binding site n=1 Tax=Citrifermentans bemidjiense (strain ATCC BAA-1014 / DSM 16622 / JCM 12645 / Bem) TaxID=404380 RepID=B5E8L8_CITBB|nr:c-type cytochrome [Citrifermentans bemidjiense]ACH38603.1 lipoprotein cytochrome c, 1 heme-binding site [Citrifermentans bemidjiense Bem]
MQRRLVVTLAILALVATCVTGCKKKSEEQAQPPQSTTAAPAAPATPQPAASATATTGEQLFKLHCAACHPNGGNTITPAKTLSKKAMADRNIKSTDDIVKIMRNPGPGMNKFDEGMIPKDDAKKIGDYILATFP